MKALKKSVSSTPAAAPLITGREVDRQTTLSRSQRYRLIAEGKFPQPVRLSVRQVAWRQSDVTAWIESRTVGVLAAPLQFAKSPE